MPHSSRIHLVTGKGGVGKTHAACLLAAALAAAGRPVLLAQIQGGGQALPPLGEVPSPGQPAPAAGVPNLWLVDITPEAAIREYALMILRFEALYRAVFENAVVKRFIRLVPSLGELTMLGKIWFHSQVEGGAHPPLADIVVDLPATGHALSMLGAPAAVRATVPVGPMHDQGERLARMLTAPATTRLYVVTLDEAMPVTEARELEEGCRRLGVPLGQVVVNHDRPPLPAGAAALLAPLADHDDGRRVPAALEAYEARRRNGAQELARLGRDAVAAAIRLPHLGPWAPGALAPGAATAPFAAVAEGPWGPPA